MIFFDFLDYWIFGNFRFVAFCLFFVVVSQFLIPSQQIVPLNKCVCEKADVF